MDIFSRAELLKKSLKEKYTKEYDRWLVLKVSYIFNVVYLQTHTGTTLPYTIGWSCISHTDHKIMIHMIISRVGEETSGRRARKRTRKNKKTE